MLSNPETSPSHDSDNDLCRQPPAQHVDESSRSGDEPTQGSFIAMLLCEPYKSSSYYVCELVRGATSYLESQGVSLSIISAPPSRWPKAFAESCAGVLVIPTRLDDQDVKLIEEMGTPYVIIADSSLRGATIDMQMGPAASQLTELLLDHGHRKFVLISGHEHHSDAVKRRAILRTLEAAGIDPQTVPDLKTNYDPIQAERAATDLLKLVPQPTAVIGFNDDLAVHALTTVQQAGIKVPEQMSIVGFNDSPSAGLLFPRLTTIRLRIAEAGRAAAEAVWHARQTGQSPAYSSLPSMLVIRDSVTIAP